MKILIEPSDYLTHDIDYVNEPLNLVNWTKSKLLRNFLIFFFP